MNNSKHTTEQPATTVFDNPLRILFSALAWYEKRHPALLMLIGVPGVLFSVGVMLFSDIAIQTRLGLALITFLVTAPAFTMGMGKLASLDRSANVFDDDQDDFLDTEINPASGEPMVGGVDTSGNPFGTG